MTDAQVVLGSLGDEGLAGGELSLDADAAYEAMARLGKSCGLDTDQAAEGVLRVVRATMARAIRSVSIERGKDVRRYALVAFGGAGPLHATALARELGISTILVPPAPGALAALGLLVASHRVPASVSRPMTAEPSADADLRTILRELADGALDELAEEGIPREEASVEFAVDCRYTGQSHELRIAVAGEPSFARVVDAFHAAHRERFGFARPDATVDAITFRAAASGPPGEVQAAAPRSSGVPEPVAARRIGGDEVPVYERGDLPAGWRCDGPVIVTELDSTTWIDPDASAEVHPSGTLLVSVR